MRHIGSPNTQLRLEGPAANSLPKQVKKSGALLAILAFCLGIVLGATNREPVMVEIKAVDQSLGGIFSDTRDAIFPTELQMACAEAGLSDCDYMTRFRLVRKIESTVGPIFTSTAYCWNPAGGCYIGTKHQNARLAEMLRIPANQAILAADSGFEYWRIDPYRLNDGSEPSRTVPPVPLDKGRGA